MYGTTIPESLDMFTYKGWSEKPIPIGEKRLVPLYNPSWGLDYGGVGHVSRCCYYFRRKHKGFPYLVVIKFDHPIEEETFDEIKTFFSKQKQPI